MPPPKRRCAALVLALAALLACGAAAADDAKRLIEQARAAGREDRNADAAQLWQAALAAAPARRAEIIPALAWQLLWSDAPAAAEALFREWLGVTATPAQRAEALDGLAQSLQAQRRQREALAAFREALALTPHDLRLQRRLATSLLWNDEPAQAVAALQSLLDRGGDAAGRRELLWMLANAQNFNGQHRLALATFAQAGAPRNAGERLDLARALYWAGDADAAAPLLADGTSRDARELRERHVGRERAAFGYATLDGAEDRDGLHSRALVVGAGMPLAPGLGAEASLRRLRLRQGADAADGEQFELSLRARFGGARAELGTAWLGAALRQVRHDGWQPIRGALRLRWIPHDRWRIDAEAGREGVETPRAIRERVSVDVLAVSVEMRPDARRGWAVAAARQRFDDGTTRLRLTGRAEVRPAGLAGWRFGVEGGWLDRTASPPGGAADRGYWNPRRYAELRPFAAWSHAADGHEWQARAGIGRSFERGDDGSTSRGSPRAWEFGWAVDASPRWRLRLALGGVGQGFALSGSGRPGYWRRYANLSLNGWVF